MDSRTASGTRPLKPDLMQAKEYLGLLDPSTRWHTLQSFDDDKERKAKHLARVINATSFKAELLDLHNRGAGVFVTA